MLDFTFCEHTGFGERHIMVHRYSSETFQTSKIVNGQIREPLQERSYNVSRQLFEGLSPYLYYVCVFTQTHEKTSRVSIHEFDYK